MQEYEPGPHLLIITGRKGDSGRVGLQAGFFRQGLTDLLLLPR